LTCSSRLEEAVGEAERQQVSDDILAQIVVDPKHGGLRKDRTDGVVQLPRGRDVVSERLFHDHPRVIGAAGTPQALDNRGEETGGMAR